MTSIARKTLTATLAALTLGATLFATADAASARPGIRGGGFHGGVVRHHGGWGRGAGIGLGIGALALGAALAAPAYYGDCYITRRAVVNRFGDVVGYRRVRVCD
jgi:hypothetical protein